MSGIVISGLTLKLAADIERVQRIAVSIMIGDTQLPYVLGFAAKTVKADCRHHHLFQLEKNGMHFACGNNIYREHICTTRPILQEPSTLPNQNAEPAITLLCYQ